MGRPTILSLGPLATSSDIFFDPDLVIPLIILALGFLAPFLTFCIVRLRSNLLSTRRRLNHFSTVQTDRCSCNWSRTATGTRLQTWTLPIIVSQEGKPGAFASHPRIVFIPPLGSPVVRSRDPVCPVHTSDLPRQSYITDPTLRNPNPDEKETLEMLRGDFPFQSSKPRSQTPALIHSTKIGDDSTSSLSRLSRKQTQETVPLPSSPDLLEQNSYPEDLSLEYLTILPPAVPAEAQSRVTTPSTDGQPSMNSGEETSDTEDGISMDESLSNMSLEENTTTDIFIQTVNQDGSESEIDMANSEGFRSGGSSILAHEGQPRDASDASETGGSSSRSGSSTGGSGHQTGSKRSRSHRDDAGAGDNNGDQPSKKSNRNQGHGVEEEKNPSQIKWFPCLMRQKEGCFGNAKDISNLVRDIGRHHRVVVCVKCYNLLTYSGDGKGADKFVKKHQESDQCKRRCISQPCGDGSGAIHLRSDGCKKTPSGDIWRFIWGLVNHGDPPKEIYDSRGENHGLTPSPRKVNTQNMTREEEEALRDLVNELQDEVKAARKSLDRERQQHEEAERQLRTEIIMKDCKIALLEGEVKAAKEQLDRERQENKSNIDQRDEIILCFVEHQVQYSVVVETSQQMRILRVCPKIFYHGLAKQMRLQQTSSASFIEVLDPAISNPGSYPPTPDSAQHGNGNVQQIPEMQRQSETTHDVIHDELMYGTADNASYSDVNDTLQQFTNLNEAHGDLAEPDLSGMGTWHSKLHM